jgi:hypothetical protein
MNVRSFAVSGAIMVCTFAAMTPRARAGVTVLPGGSTVAGKSIGEHTADWWSWVLSRPAPTDALSDTTGAAANADQSGPVFYVAGSGFGAGAINRSFTVPADKYILLPIFNFLVFPPPDPGFSTTAEEAEFLTTEVIKPATLFASIDGVDVSDIASHLERAPTNFTLHAVAGNVSGAPAGDSESNATGYWLMIAPLGEGKHTFKFGGTSEPFTFPGTDIQAPAFSVDVTDNVTASAVPLPPAVWPALGTLAAVGAVGLARRRRASRAS